MFVKATATAVGLVLLTAAAAQSATLRFAAHLTGAQEVPANATTGSGDVTAKVDTNTHLMTYSVTYSGLTGPATAAHFHGPAAPGVNAGPVVMLKALASPISGSADLTDAQFADLQGGKWYFNVHTAAHPGGEIRGQLMKTKSGFSLF